MHLLNKYLSAQSSRSRQWASSSGKTEKALARLVGGAGWEKENEQVNWLEHIKGETDQCSENRAGEERERGGEAGDH